MNREIVGDKLEVFENYSETMTIIFITMYFFSALPILLPMMFMCFFFRYFIEKFLICNFYSKVFLDSKINT